MLRFYLKQNLNLGYFFSDLAGIYLTGGKVIYDNSRSGYGGGYSYGIGVVKFSESKNGLYLYGEVAQALYESKGYKGVVGGGVKFDRYFSIDLSFSYARTGSGYWTEEFVSIFFAFNAWTF